VECNWKEGSLQLDSEILSFSLSYFAEKNCPFLAYPLENEGNPFKDKLVPLAESSSVLQYSVAALVSRHLYRNNSTRLYNIALQLLQAALLDPLVARSDSTLGACLLLCLYEVNSELRVYLGSATNFVHR
jgi:hypothetical protein